MSRPPPHKRCTPWGNGARDCPRDHRRSCSPRAPVHYLRAPSHREHLPPPRPLHRPAHPHPANEAAPNASPGRSTATPRTTPASSPPRQRVRPPFRALWVHNSHALLEFPPVIYGDRIFQLADNARPDRHRQADRAHHLDATGSGTLSASTPAVTSNTVYVTVLDGGRSGAPGRVVALSAQTGAIRWSRRASQRQRVLADARPRHASSSAPRTGPSTPSTTAPASVIWTYHAAGAVKASPSLSGGVLYFGDYSGHVQAISEQTGGSCGAAAPKGPCWAAAPSTPPPRSSTGASSSATPTGACTPTTPPPGSSTGPSRRAPTCTPPRPSRTPPGSDPPSTSAPTTAPSTPSTPARARSPGSFNAHAASISGSATIIGRIVYFADLGLPPHLRPRHLHRHGYLRNGHRRLRPRHQRRPRHLPDRLHGTVRAGTAGSRRLDAPAATTTKATTTKKR